jgi:squalene-hopene/tetraprenyl-beta-curcumene cyclase
LALKVAGDSANTASLQRARDTIVTLGGIERANTYTRYWLALFGQFPWKRVPAIPPEMVLLPEGGPFSIYDLSSWSRTIFVPLSIVYAHRPVCALPPERGVSELFATPRAQAARVTAISAEPFSRAAGKRFFQGVDRLLKLGEPGLARSPLRKRALTAAAEWMIARFEKSEGLSAILPAMADSLMALRCLGHAEDDALFQRQLAHVDGLLWREGAALRMQPCLSPVWDTVLSSHALLEAGVSADHPALVRAASWLLSKQCREAGDWSRRVNVPPGGWYFEAQNEFYPDVDDTCMALMVLTRARGLDQRQPAALERGLTWMLAMQNRDGGWASFDRDNDKQWLTYVPFADHNAMIDPSTADITGRVLECLSHFPRQRFSESVVQRAVAFLRRDQATDGSWYGRWGVNYLYGTWQVLRGLRAIGEDMRQPYVQRAAHWLLQHQNADGGWGESIASYGDARWKGTGESTASQTAWAVMGLIAAGLQESPAVRRGVHHLLERQTSAGTWQQEPWTGTGFPGVFYLNYHGYRHYFPLMALGQYRAARWGQPRAD